jgi:hypothetical protein
MLSLETLLVFTLASFVLALAAGLAFDRKTA